MSDKTNSTFWPNFWSANPLLQSAAEYSVDAIQRSVLYADVMRQRGNQYKAHMEEQIPNVLSFPSEPVMMGTELERPVNYGLVRILPSKDTPTDTSKRPFVIVDPRAGHGPGIGGFKPESEIGSALRAGHPCYFIGFSPEPMAGQTIEDVMRAEARFLEKVIELHPDTGGKPAVIGNCQAGWQILMTAAMRPELFGPIILAGTPVSYWAGWKGKNPMRYTGGLLGGSWLTALTGDMGSGRFDGAYLVQNFENLNPANTLWSKQYNLYSKVDSEAERYLGFEKYWGGYVFLNDVEMQYIVDNLFVGNKLSTAQLITSDGTRLDLRNIRSPIVVFCSYGDNITPPPQALGWITDLYQDDKAVLAHDQTIVYATHESIGHLGIFVSSSTGRKEHNKIASNIDLIDMLPSGIYEAVLEDKTATTPGKALATGDYVMKLQARRLADVREIVQPDEQSDRRFAAVARFSERNLGLYRSFVQPFVRAAVTPQFSDWLRTMHPMRTTYEWWSDSNPLAKNLAVQAEQVREHRQPVSPDNPFLQWQECVSDTIEQGLNMYRDIRDDIYERSFEAMYSSLLVQSLTGLQADPSLPVRPNPGITPEYRMFMEQEFKRLQHRLGEGGLPEAGVRCLIHVLGSDLGADERRFAVLRQFVEDRQGTDLRIHAARALIREQCNLMRLDYETALREVPSLLVQVPAEEIRTLGKLLEEAVNAAGTPSAGTATHMTEVHALLDEAIQRNKPGQQAVKSGNASRARIAHKSTANEGGRA